MSEEKKNLGEQPEQNEKPEVAPVEKKEEAKKPLSKKTIGLIAGIAAAVVIIAVVLILVLGGGKGSETPETPETPADPGTNDPGTGNNPDTPAVTEKNYSLGMGLVFGEITNAQTNATIATVVLDENGVIVACKIDAIQNKYTISDENGVVLTLLDTKKELGDAYGMATSQWSSDNNGDGIVLEWFQQAAAFEAWCVGKTAAELEAHELQNLHDHWVSTDDALLSAGCTIQIGDFIGAVVKACKDEQSMSFKTSGTITLGLAANNADNGSKGDTFEATVSMNTDFAAVVLVDGKIVAALNDATQPQVKVEDGSVVSADVGKKDADGNSLGLLTKRELKEGYGMAGKVDNNGDGIKLEWYLQSAAFSAYVVGKTPAEVAALETTLVNGHYISTDDELLNAGCTIQITGIQAVVAEAGGYVAPEKEYTLGLGLVFGELKNNEANATIATVILDENGVIVACKIDAIQNKYSITVDGVEFTKLDTKKELGDAYGMAGNAWSSDNDGDGRILEWHQQAAAFETWCVGKTVAQVEALAAEENLQFANNHYFTKDEDLLSAGCTIQIGDFVGAVVKACNDDQSMSFKTSGTVSLGLAANNADNGSKGDDFEATVSMNTDFAAVAVVDGKIVAALNDAIQPQLTVLDATDVTSTSVGKGEGILKTKRELKEDYGMAGKVDNNGDGIKLEWYVQSAAFSEYVVGLTGAEVAALETVLVNGHYISTDDVLLNAGCTIQITGIQAVVAEAVDNAN